MLTSVIVHGRSGKTTAMLARQNQCQGWPHGRTVLSNLERSFRRSLTTIDSSWGVSQIGGINGSASPRSQFANVELLHSMRGYSTLQRSTNTLFCHVTVLSSWEPALGRVLVRAYFSTDSSSGDKIKVPTPTQQFSTLTTGEDGKKETIAQRAKSAVVSTTKVVWQFTYQLPGNVWFFLTHPAELRQRMSDIQEMVRKEAHHYWMGTKLLWADIVTARKLVGKTLQGSALTRRERKQLLRTVSDLFRLVPFSMFIIIPFMEFALPFALRLFPNLLPSTFQDSLKAEENMKRELQSRIAMAQFFQETLEELAKEQKRKAATRKKQIHADGSSTQDDEIIASKQEETAASMLEFLQKARSGEMIPPDMIIQYANFFEDDLTLDNMPRMQLINMCKYMNIPPYGANSFLRFQLRHKIRSLKEDDQRILWEGIDSLTKMELREACRERGMRSTGLSKEAYKRALQQWLDLSVNKKVPIALLIMSRTFFLRDEMITATQEDDSRSVAGLADAISGLDKIVVNEVILGMATSEEKKSSPDVRKIKLEVLEHQNERIREEEQEREAAAKKKEQGKEKVEPAELDDSTKAPLPAEDGKAETKASTIGTVVPSPKPELKVAKETEPSVQEEDDEHDLSTQEMDAISQMLSADPVRKERAELERIKAAMKAGDDGEVSKGRDEDKSAEDLRDSDKKAADALTESKPQIDQAPTSPPTSEEVDKIAEATISEMNRAAKLEADRSNLIQEKDIVTSESSTPADAVPLAKDEPEDPVIARLKKRLQSMVGKIEVQLSKVQVKIGDKLHFLDKDRDGILSREEMADCLQQVLKRKITFEEAMEIANTMDENKDGVFTVQELIKWIETNKLVKLVEEGRDADVDRIVIELKSSDAEGRETSDAQK